MLPIRACCPSFSDSIHFLKSFFIFIKIWIITSFLEIFLWKIGGFSQFFEISIHFCILWGQKNDHLNFNDASIFPIWKIYLSKRSNLSNQWYNEISQAIIIAVTNNQLVVFTTNDRQMTGKEIETEGKLRSNEIFNFFKRCVITRTVVVVAVIVFVFCCRFWCYCYYYIN